MNPLRMNIVMLPMLLLSGASMAPSNQPSSGGQRFLVIGDLHGDAQCAQQWIDAIGVISRTEDGEMRWTGGDTRLFFMGDYVDKGTDGRGVLELIRKLTETFPTRVTALLGNHDLYLLADAVLEQGSAAFMGTSVRDFSYAFSHPAEYLNWEGERDDDVLRALYEALQRVYRKRGEAQVMLRELEGDAAQAWPNRQLLHNVAQPLKGNSTLARMVLARLDAWQARQSKVLIDSGLAAWLAERPIMVHKGDSLFVHAGVASSDLARIVQGLNSTSVLPHMISKVNRFSARIRAAMEQHGASFRPIKVSELVVPEEDMDLLMSTVNYRGYFGKHGRGCAEVQRVLQLLAPHVRRIVVGHTAEEDVRFMCEGQLIAVDSSLSRHFRAYGNRYCPPQGYVDPPLPHSGCDMPLPATCEGQILELRHGEHHSNWTARTMDVNGRYCSESNTTDAEQYTHPGPGRWSQALSALAAMVL